MSRRNLFIAFLLCFPYITSQSLGESGPIYDTDNMPMGMFHNNGDITGSNGILIGTLGTGGTILDTDNMPIGVIRSNGDVLGSNGILIATVPDPRIGALIALHVINLKSPLHH